ncbi:hypothetical protein E5Q_04828 [Mixia osmundae IAM 14324]|uniref:N(6)-L-threonylcarbamoyladenine synthase n=2 Tax=Mixia osmundae (strain CBS 9802 / IAM 14324 / JCM 22182 / KY 12970) TaxID=764103 RepID=G7E5N5_MIXOS|nr:hypothetical protein E5Q_04828 [Mixia osmundae IAM 14324]
MPGAIQTALTQARVTMADLDAIAFTRGPGMLSCLTVASVAARSLAAALDKPLVGVHHMQAHALTPFLTEDVPPEFPFLTLLVSGGHTLIALARSSSQFELLATTRDNAIGEAIDHVARLLAVPWMGSPGSALERFAASARELPGFDCPDFRSHPTKENKARFGYFSFSGLKSSVQRFVSEQGGTDALSEDQRKVIAQRFQSTAIMQLERTLAVTLADLTIKPTALVVSGGVASNALLRNRLRECLDGQGRTETRLIFPPVALCTDNAAMIAWTAIDRLKRGFHTDSLAVASHPVWSIESCESGGPV